MKKSLLFAIFLLKNLLLAFLAFTCFSCIKTRNDSWNIVNQKIQNSPVFYSQQMREFKIEKKQNFFTQDEILNNKIDNFLYLYKYRKSNDTIKINLVEIKSGKMFEFLFLNLENRNTKLLSLKTFRTKIENNEGTKLYYKVLDSYKI